MVGIKNCTIAKKVHRLAYDNIHTLYTYTYLCLIGKILEILFLHIIQ